MKHNSFAISQLQYNEYFRMVNAQSDSGEQSMFAKTENAEETNRGSTGSLGSSVDDANKNLKISVIGAGAMGSLVAGRLAKNGNYDVSLISSWEEHVKTISESGLMIREVGRDGLLEGELVRAGASKFSEASVNTQGSFWLFLIVGV